MYAARVLLATALAVGLSACSPFGDPAEEAHAALVAEDYLSARDLALATLEGDATNVAALEVLARALLAMGQGGDAANALQRIADAGGDLPDEALLSAEAQLQLGNPAEALALVGNDQSAEGFRLRALAETMQGNDAAARQAFATGRSAEGDRGKLLAAEASFHLDRGEVDAAAEAAAFAREQAPQRVETLYVGARVAEAQGDHVLALSNYLRIIDKVPMDRPALLHGIAAAERAGQPEIMRHLILYGAATRPNDPEFAYQLARLDARARNWESVRARLQQHEAAWLDYPAARLLYAESLLELGQVETARAMAAPLVARFPGDPEVARIQSAIEAAS
jgi:predicted Zn-dependent protease